MKNLFCILILAITLSGCDSPVVGSFKDMYDIRSKVQKITHTDEISVNINNGAYLSVSVINSPFNTETSKERKDISDKIANVAYNNFNNRKYLKKIFVVFASHERKYLIVDYTSTIDNFSYTPGELVVKKESESTSHHASIARPSDVHTVKPNVVKSN